MSKPTNRSAKIYYVGSTECEICPLRGNDPDCWCEVIGEQTVSDLELASVIGTARFFTDKNTEILIS